MAEVNPPFALQNRSDHGAAGDRLPWASLVKSHGRVAASEMLITATSTPDMYVHISAGRTFVQGTSNTYQGFYHCFNDGDVALRVTDAHATLNRIDLIIAEVLDSFYTGTNDKWQLRIVAGTPASNPSAPALPASAVQLGTVAVGASVSQINNANITILGPLADIANQVVANATELARVVGVVGQLVFRDDLDLLLCWNGVVWDPCSVYRGSASPAHYQARMWFNTNDSTMKFSDGSAWTDFGTGSQPAIPISDNSPTPSDDGPLWVEY